MFQDEARFGRINDPRRCWAPRGLRRQVCARIVREYTYVFAAVSPQDGTLDTLALPEVNAFSMSVFLDEVAQRHPQENILMVLDGAGWHRARDLRIPENRQLLALPPYSPQLNPVEHLWEKIREKWFPNLVFDSLAGVADRLVEALATLENSPDRVAQITGFDWILSIPMNATQYEYRRKSIFCNLHPARIGNRSEERHWYGRHGSLEFRGNQGGSPQLFKGLRLWPVEFGSCGLNQPLVPAALNLWQDRSPRHGLPCAVVPARAASVIQRLGGAFRCSALNKPGVLRG